jgi:hypothetical protein
MGRQPPTDEPCRSAIFRASAALPRACFIRLNKFFRELYQQTILYPMLATAKMDAS